MNFTKRTQWYILKLPLIFILVVVGFILEFVVTFPFAMAYHLDTLLNRHTRLRSGK